MNAGQESRERGSLAGQSREQERQTAYALALLVLAGDPPAGMAAAALQRLAAEPGALIVAADGGADALAALGLRPHLIVGDGDSITTQAFADVPRLAFPAAKNFTDGEAALRAAAERCPQGPLHIFGAFGGRPDHYWGNLCLPIFALDDATRVTLYHQNLRGYYSCGWLRLCGQPGDTVSLLPLTAAQDIWLQGFVYPLAGYDAVVGDTRTLCNVLAARQAEIRHSGGRLLVIHFLSREDS